MTFAEFLLQDYDTEMKGTRTILERIPTRLVAFKPHERSAAAGKLAIHVATLPLFATTILTTDGINLATTKFPNPDFESTERTLKLFDENAAEARGHLAAASDEHLQQNWKMSFAFKTITDSPRSLLFRTLFFNHLIHHRAQLGVYLRLNELPVPALYGPSADDRMGF